MASLQAGARVYENRQRLWDGLKAYQGVAQNAKVIVNTVVQRAAEKVTSTVAEAAKSVTGFFGRLFGGGASAPAQPQPTPPPTATPPPARTPAPSVTPRPATRPRPASAPRPAASPAKPQPGAWRGR